MFILLIGLLAAASAAPYVSNNRFRSNLHSSFQHNQGFGDPYFRDDIFDTGRFWADISNELKQLDDLLGDFSKRFPSSVSSEGVVGNEYKIRIPLTGFEEKDIVVKARVGLLMVQAVHKIGEGSTRNYLDVRTLPECVNVTGSWTYDQDILNIVFPVKESAVVESNHPTDATVGFQTEAPTLHSREEIETNADDNHSDADVGLGRGDTDILTNEISGNSVEATTYAVDLKDEVEFVPVHI